ncbi:putative metalloprotease [Alternaria alternata]|nr:putative metalloprotease [Alternaria alternata]
MGDRGRNGLPDILDVDLRYGPKYWLRGDLVELRGDCSGRLHEAMSSRLPSSMCRPPLCGICTSTTKSSRLEPAMRVSPSWRDCSRRGRDAGSCGRLLSSGLAAGNERSSSKRQ